MPSPYFQVIYLDEILNKLPENPYFMLLDLMVSRRNLKKDIEKVKKIYQKFGDDAKKYVDLCLILLSSKYENITLNDLYAMLPSFRDQLLRSRAIQEIIEMATHENTEKVTEKVTKKVTKKVTQQVTLDNMLAFAKRLIEDGDYDPNHISRLTGLPTEEVNKLIEQTKLV